MQETESSLFDMKNIDKKISQDTKSSAQDAESDAQISDSGTENAEFAVKKSNQAAKNAESSAQDAESLEEVPFRETMAELEQIISMLEGNNLELEESLEKYERGIKLLSSLNKKLASAEQKVEMLTGKLSGEKDDSVRDSTLS